MACLPRSSRLRADEAEAERYRLTLAIDAQAPGIGSAAWRVEGYLDRQFSRTYTDGSAAYALRFAQLAERWDDEPRPSPLDGAVVELRGFASGRIVDVGPLGAWAGTRGHVELLEALWVLLSPAIPVGGVVAEVSFPIKLLHGPSARTRWTTAWSGGGDAWTGAAVIDAAGGGGVGWMGRADLDLRFAGPGLVSGRATSTREVRAPWLGEGVVETQAIEVSLERAGATSGFLLPRAGVLGTRADDGRPTLRADGTPLADVPADAAAVRPYLLVPAGPGRAAPEESPPVTIPAVRP